MKFHEFATIAMNIWIVGTMVKSNQKSSMSVLYLGSTISILVTYFAWIFK